MFDFLKPKKKPEMISKEDIASLLKISPEALYEFEEAYKTHVLSQDSDNLYEVSAKQAKERAQTFNVGDEALTEDDVKASAQLVDRIVDELIACTKVYRYKNGEASITEIPGLPDNTKLVTNDDVKSLPESLRPQCTGTLMSVDINGESYVALLDMYSRYLKSPNTKAGMDCYHRFRQGLDILDLDWLTYQMIGTNPNSMGNWLPKIVTPVKDEGFFKIPNTTIIKVPMELLQLTRKDWGLLTKASLDIVDKYCYKVFELKDDGDYFIKTGTHCSKFDFRNARVVGAEEVRTLGEYLLYIHFQALCMAHYDLSGRHQPIIYGVSTTNEWVVRDFIPDAENNPCIYNGLPLHTEYRAFVDFDTDEVLGIHPYWDPEVMKTRFSKGADAQEPKQVHDYITYMAAEEKLMQRYNDNKDMVTEHLKALVSDVELSGQWSIDIMQNGDDFWLIDMALAKDSAYVDNVIPAYKRIDAQEDWLPKLNA